MVFDVIGGALEGPRLRGKFVGAGADWLLVGPDGFGRLDVRAQIETDDGALVYVQYQGLIQMNEKVQAAMGSASGTEFSDQYFKNSRLVITDTFGSINRCLLQRAGCIQDLESSTKYSAWLEMESAASDFLFDSDSPEVYSVRPNFRIKR